MIAQVELDLLGGFERALLNDRLHMVYQPKVALSNGRLVRVEALVRWEDSTLGVVPPSRFVPVAERCGLIDKLTEWGLGTTLRQWNHWRETGLNTSLAFNISALSLQHLNFPDLVERMCHEYGVPTEQLVLELTESATQPLVNLMDTLTRFRIKGIGLAIDDFGTGYSSLMQLRQLPFTELKIDRFFVTDAVQSNDSRAIVQLVIELAHRLGLTATAEGVETPDQLKLLRELGCDVAQGYLVSRPLEANSLADWQREFRLEWEHLVS